MKTIAIFDLDHTLISVDCSNEWIKFMCELGLIDNKDAYLYQKDLYDQAYQRGKVDMTSFYNFILKPMLQKKLTSLEKNFNIFAKKIVANFSYREA